MTVLSYEEVTTWIRPNRNFARPAFVHRRFAISTDTLYLVAKEGAGTARAISAGLVMEVLDSAEMTATALLGGRLKAPMMTVLVETANMVRWRELPDVYSNYGSRHRSLHVFPILEAGAGGRWASRYE